MRPAHPTINLLYDVLFSGTSTISRGDVLMAGKEWIRSKVCEEFVETQLSKQRAEFLKDLKRAYKKPSTGLCWSEVRKTIEKWEGRLSDATDKEELMGL